MPSLQAPRPVALSCPAPRIARTRFAGLLAALLLSGCSAGNYPSLARWPTPQPAASGQMAAPAAPVVTQALPGAGCDGALADSIDNDFRTALPGTESALRAVGKAEPGSPVWSKGNIALAELQKIRGHLDQVLAPAQAAYVADTINHAQDDARDGIAQRGDGATLAACHAHIDSLATQEDEQIDRLHALLPD